MRLKNHLNELSMNKKTEIKYRITPDTYGAFITLEDGQEYEIWARKHKYEADFLKTVHKLITDLPYVYKWEVFFTDVERNIDTVAKPSGTSLELFAAIEIFFRNFMKANNPDMLSFSSSTSDKSKLRLYTSLGKRIAKAGYIHITHFGDQILIKKKIVKGFAKI